MMRLRKRWLVVKAALTQSWHTHRCGSCQAEWWCQGSACELLRPEDQCAACFVVAHDAWLNKPRMVLLHAETSWSAGRGGR